MYIRKTLALTVLVLFIGMALVISLQSRQRPNTNNVLSAAIHITPFPTPSPTAWINCDYYRANWIQFKRDFMETQLGNYSSSSSAQAAMYSYFPQFQQEALRNGCTPPQQP